MRKLLLASAVCVITIAASLQAAAQQRIAAAPSAAADDETLVDGRLAVSAPVNRLRVSALGNQNVRTGDNSTQAVRDIVVESFSEQQTFATRIWGELPFLAGALLALPEIDDEVLVYDDAYVVRRRTTIIVRDPDRIARESELYRNYLGERSPQRAGRGIEELEPEDT